MPKIARELSALEVGRLKAPGLVSVGGVPGLSLQVNPTGARSWILRVKIGTARRDMGLGNLGVNGPVRNHAKHTGQGLACGYGVIADIGMGMSADKAGHIARPDIRLSQVRWWFHAEVTAVAVAFLEGLIVAAHSRMVTAVQPLDAPPDSNRW